MDQTIGIILLIIVFSCLFYYIHAQTKLADDITKSLEVKK